MTSMLVLVPQQDLRAAWPLVRPQVAELRAATREPWPETHVLEELFKGRAELWADEAREAFVVTSIQCAPYTRDLHVWIASNHTEDRAFDYWPQIEEIGRSHGCDRIVFESPRRWQRAIPGLTCRYLYTAEL